MQPFVQVRIGSFLSSTVYFSLLCGGRDVTGADVSCYDGLMCDTSLELRLVILVVGPLLRKREFYRQPS